MNSAILNVINRAKYIGVLCLALVGFAFVSPTTGQSLQPVVPEIERPDKDETQAIYQLTKTAKSFDDYQSIARRCRQSPGFKSSDKNGKYLNSLCAWAENRMAETHIKNAIGLRKMGMQEQSDEQMKRAIKMYDRVIKSHPLTWRAWMGRAVIHAEQGQYQAALKEFRQVVKLDSKNKNARFNCAELAFALKQYDDAIKDYSRLIEDDPTDVQAQTGRAHCLLAQQKPDKSIGDYQTVVKLQPDNRNGLSNLSDAYRANGQTELAKMVLGERAYDRQAVRSVENATRR